MKVPETGIPTTGHGVITGASGAGKTNLLHLGIMSRLQAGHKVPIIDTKAELEQIYGKHAQVVGLERANETVRSLISIADERMKLFSETAKSMRRPIPDIDKYEIVTGQKMPRITLVVEELIRLLEVIDLDKLTSLFAIGRSSGVYCWVIAQYLNAKVLPKAASANLHTKIYLGPPDQFAFKALFPGGIPSHIEVDLETLGPVGYGLCFINNQFSYRQFPEVDEELLMEWM